MIDEEEKAMDLINEFLNNEDLPMHRIKCLTLQWDTVAGANLPILTCEFHKKPKRRSILKWMRDFMKR